MKKRILYIHHTFRAHSYNSLLLEFAKRVSKEKYEILVCCLREGGPYEKIFEDFGLRVRNFSMRTVFDFSVVFKIVNYIRQNNIHIVHTAVFPADVYGRIAARLAGVPVILSTMHRFEDHKQERNYRIFFWLDRITMTLTTRIIAVSETVRSYLVQWHRVNPNKIATLYNGIDIARFGSNIEHEHLRTEFNLQADYLNVGAIGRFVPVKGFEYFLEAIPRILRKTKKLHFLLVGDGPLENDLKRKASDLGILEHTVFTGFRHDIPAILSLLDVFVTPSLSEGLPTAVLEAMSAGKPVVATNVGGNAEAVVNGDNGILVPPRHPAALADAILELLESPGKRYTMGQEGKRRVAEQFSIEKMAREYEAFYDSCWNQNFQVNMAK